jgi:hypothetical protein
MLHFYEDAPNVAAKDAVEPALTAAYEEVRQILSELPEDIHIWLDNWCLIPETGDGGFAYSPNELTIAYDIDFKDKALQQKSLRQTIFHEGYHLVQGHTNEQPHAQYKTALDSAIYEGCAVVFERKYAGSDPLWGHYEKHDEATLTEWRNAMMKISIDDFVKNDGEIWRTWAFYDELTEERWRLYKVGTWLVDSALQRSGKDILDFRKLSAEEILDLI